jgi:hypothetical protein
MFYSSTILDMPTMPILDVYLLKLTYLDRNEGENSENADLVQDITPPSSGKPYI